MRELLDVLARSLVREPQRVRVRERAERDRVVLELEVAPGDRGRIIGRAGRTAHALRTLVEAAGRRRGSRCVLEIWD